MNEIFSILVELERIFYVFEIANSKEFYYISIFTRYCVRFNLVI